MYSNCNSHFVVVCLCAHFVLVSSAAQAPIFPWFNLTIPRPERLSLLVAAMTVQEKVGRERNVVLSSFKTRAHALVLHTFALRTLPIRIAVLAAVRANTSLWHTPPLCGVDCVAE